MLVELSSKTEAPRREVKLIPMPEKPKETAWIQNLKKDEIIAELEEGGEVVEKTNNYNKLREQLKESIKRERETYQTPENSDSETESDEEDNMAEIINSNFSQTTIGNFSRKSSTVYSLRRI